MPTANESRLIASGCELAVGGLVPLTTNDFPGALAAVLFCQGCPWRCRYCHNPHLQPFGHGSISWHEIMRFLDKRRGLLDAVVFSGGEPLVQKDLLQAIQDVKALGFKVGLHTGGCLPDLLKQLLPLLDWVGLDIKSSANEYSEVTGIKGSGDAAWQSAQLLASTSVAFEVRTTRHQKLLSDSDLFSIARQLQQLGVRQFALQEFRSTGCTDTELNLCGSISAGIDCIDQLRNMFDRFEYRAL